MDPVTLGAIIQTGGSMANTTGDILSNAFFGRRNENWAREDATTAFNRQRQLLAEQRAYETPAAQMRRYIEAGLHPGLIYGQQQGSIAPPSVPAAHTANVSPPSMSLDSSAFLQGEYIKAQIRRLENQNENDDKRTENEVANGLSQRGVNSAEIDNLRASTSLLSAETEKTVIGSMLLSEQRRSVALDNTFKMTTMRDAIDKFSYECKIARAQSQSIAELLGAQIFGLKAKARSDIASAGLSSAMVGQVNAVADLYRQELKIDRLDFAFRTGVSPDGRIIDNNRRNLFLNSIESAYSQTVDQSRIFKKSADLLEKYGDSKEMLQLILLGSQTVKNFSESISTFMPNRSINTSTSNVHHFYDD